MSLKQLEKAGEIAIRKLRKDKLMNGQPFMINSGQLPLGQCYLEYPDGSINIVTICKEIYDFKILKQLSVEEIKKLRLEYKLF